MFYNFDPSAVEFLVCDIYYYFFIFLKVYLAMTSDYVTMSPITASASTAP